MRGPEDPGKAPDKREDSFHRLVELVDTLRGPDGCPWDQEQTRETLMPLLVEESFELLEALDQGAPEEVCEELGDLLFQVLFHSRIAKEDGEFDVYDVCRQTLEKMIRRHPHVFGDDSYKDSRELLKHWEEIKATERQAAGRKVKRDSLLDGIPEGLPALYLGFQMCSKASRVGFDWPDLEGIRDQLQEELEELQVALERGSESEIKEEVGDVLFTALNVARFLKVDPETALGQANRKFSRRFRRMERHFASKGQALKQVSMEEMEAFWQSNKGADGVSPVL